MITPAGRDLVTPAPPLNNLPPVQPIPKSAVVTKPTPSPEPESLLVFNRSGMVQGFSILPFPYIQIPAGKWTTTDSAKKPIPRSFAMQHLRGNPNFNVQIPHERLFANDEKHLTVAACVDGLTGWGVCNSNIIKELALLRGESVEMADWTSPVSKCDLLAYPTTYWHTEDVNDITQRLMRRPYHPTKWCLAMTIPTELHYIPAKKIVLMTMWEGNRVPDGWGEPLRQYVHHLIVPSETQKEIFAKEFSGEISVVPLGVDTDTFTFRARPQRGEDDPFTILLYGSPLTSRKSPIETIGDVCYLAFSGAFGEPVDDWKLILKTRNNILGAGKFQVPIEDSHIEVKSGYYTPQQLADLCYSADVGIALSKYEGAGLIPAEQMATGLPVILSRNSGMTELADEMFNVPIEMTGTTTPEDIGYASESGLYWYVPDWNQAARELRYQYDLWKMTGKRQMEMGTRAAEYIQRQRTWRHTALGIQNVLQKVMSEQP